jgi:DNA-binding MarR family transcriptional regulator
MPAAPRRRTAHHAAVLNAIRVIVRDLREASRAAEARFGLGAAQLFVLQTLARSPGLSINELAARTYTHQSSVSVVVKKLAQKRLVQTRRSGDDGRQRELSLTNKGYRLADRTPTAVSARLIAAVDCLPADVQMRLADGLRQLLRVMRVDSTRPAMFPEERSHKRRRIRRLNDHPRRSDRTHESRARSAR